MGNQDVALGIAQGLNGLASSLLRTKEVFNRDRELRLREQDQNMERELLVQKRKEEVDRKGALFGVVAADSLFDMKVGEVAEGKEIEILSRNTPFTDGTSIVRVKREKSGIRPTFSKDGKEWEATELIPDSTLKKASREGLTKLDPAGLEQYVRMRTAIKGLDTDKINWRDTEQAYDKTLQAVADKTVELENLPGDHGTELAQLASLQRDMLKRKNEGRVKNNLPPIEIDLTIPSTAKQTKVEKKKEDTALLKRMEDQDQMALDKIAWLKGKGTGYEDQIQGLETFRETNRNKMNKVRGSLGIPVMDTDLLVPKQEVLKNDREYQVLLNQRNLLVNKISKVKMSTDAYDAAVEKLNDMDAQLEAYIPQENAPKQDTKQLDWNKKQKQSYRDAYEKAVSGKGWGNKPGLEEKEMKMLDDRWGMTGEPGKAPHRGDKGGTKEEPAKAQEKPSSDKPPVPGAKKSLKDGKWYIQQNGKWVSIEA